MTADEAVPSSTIDRESADMRNWFTCALLLLGAGVFLALVAAEDYSWTSSKAYVRVRTGELAVIVILFTGFYLVVGTFALIHWLQCKLDQVRRWLTSR
jgi:hypothetical protein